MPDIPRVPGVPALTSYAPNAINLLLRDVIPIAIAALGGPQWGIFWNGIPVLPADTIVTFDFRKDYAIADYPIENGGFQSYDKVAQPADIRVRAACGGGVLKRQAFITAIDLITPTLNIYDVVTPEKVFLGYNFSHVDWTRRADNVGIIVADIWLTEIRETAQATFTNTQSPTIQGPQGLGSVQPQAPLQQILSSVTGGAWRFQ